MGQFEKFNKMYDVEALREELNEMKNKKGEFKEIPDGQYEVSIKKMALAESSTGKPMLKVDMVIVAGEFERQHLFINQCIDTSYGIHTANEFMRGLETGVDVGFIDYEDYADLVLEVFEKTSNFEYLVEQSTSKKGYKSFLPVDVYPLED